MLLEIASGEFIGCFDLSIDDSRSNQVNSVADCIYLCSSMNSNYAAVKTEYATFSSKIRPKILIQFI